MLRGNMSGLVDDSDWHLVLNSVDSISDFEVLNFMDVLTIVRFPTTITNIKIKYSELSAIASVSSHAA